MRGEHIGFFSKFHVKLWSDVLPPDYHESRAKRWFRNWDNLTDVNILFSLREANKFRYAKYNLRVGRYRADFLGPGSGGGEGWGEGEGRRLLSRTSFPI